MGDARNKQIFYDRLGSIMQRFIEHAQQEAARPIAPEPMCHCGKPGGGRINKTFGRG